MKKQLLLGAAVAVMLLSSCRRDPLKGLTEEESRIYITNYDTSLNYSNYKTFSIADSVAVIQNNRLVARERTSYDAEFVTAVTNALTQRGFTLISHTQNPDLGVTISRIINTQTGLV